MPNCQQVKERFFDAKYTTPSLSSLRYAAPAQATSYKPDQ